MGRKSRFTRKKEFTRALAKTTGGGEGEEGKIRRHLDEGEN